MNDSPNPKRRWYQFSLRKLQLVMLVFCVSVAWIGWRMQRARDNRDRVSAVKESVAAIQELGGKVTSVYVELRPQSWLGQLFDDPGGSDDPVGVLKVTRVNLGFIINRAGPETPDEDLFHHYLRIQRCSTHFTDTDLEHVKLKALIDLQYLDLGNAQVTNAGVEHLNGLTNLQYLDLKGTDVTYEGVKKLHQALPNCKIRHHTVTVGPENQGWSR